MTNFQKIDSTWPAADDPLDAALLQDLATNYQAALEDRLRSCVRVWDVRDPPIACGVYDWNEGNVIRRLMMPFIWRKSSRFVNEIKVRVRHTVRDGTMSVGLRVLPLTDTHRTFPRLQNMPDPDEESTGIAIRSNGETTTLTASNLDFPELDLLVLVTFKSVEVPGPAPVTATITSVQPHRLIADLSSTTDPNLRADEIPGYASEEGKVMDFQRKTGSSDWTTGAAPSPRQMINVDYTGGPTDYIYVYPPFTDANATWVSTDHDWYTDYLSGAAIYSVEIEETSVEAFPGFGSALNCGQPLDARTIRDLLYLRGERIFKECTRVHHIGPGSVNTAQIDSNFSTKYHNKVHGFVRYDSNARALGRCQVGATHQFDDIDGTNRVITAYEVTALLAVAAVGTGPAAIDAHGLTFGLDVWIKVANETDGSAVTGATETFSVAPMRVGHRYDGGRVNHPIGYLLRLYYEDNLSVASVTDSNMVSHSLLGFYPEDTWYSGRPETSADRQGGFIIYRDTIVDTNTSANGRQLSIWVQGDRDITPQPFVHLVSWTVTTRTAQSAARMSSVSTAT